MQFVGPIPPALAIFLILYLLHEKGSKAFGIGERRGAAACQKKIAAFFRGTFSVPSPSLQKKERLRAPGGQPSLISFSINLIVLIFVPVIGHFSASSLSETVPVGSYHG